MAYAWAPTRWTFVYEALRVAARTARTERPRPRPTVELGAQTAGVAAGVTTGLRAL
jgi:hypothetical protein